MSGDGRSFSLMLVTTWLTRAGAETQVKDLACEHARRGARVMVVSLREPEAFVPELTGAGVQVVSLGMPKGVADPRGIVRLARAVRRFRPDVIHSHMVHANLLSRVTRMFCRMPVLVCTAHNVDEGGRWRERMYRLTDRLADVTTNVSRAGVERYVRVRAVPAGRILWMPNGVDTHVFAASPEQRAAMRASLGLGQEFVFLSLARLETVKGVDTLLLAMERVVLDCPHVILLIAGDGSQRLPLERTLAQLELCRNKVVFLGLRKDTAKLMTASDAVVLPSRMEGLPVVLLEAASSGLPVVATDVGGSSDAVRDGDTGYLVPPDDPDALARAMVRIARAPGSERSAMGRRGRQLVEERFSLDKVADRWEEVYVRYGRHSTCRVHGEG
jgi:glycosyltransferase involved in cell wall biosynthesis